MKIVKLLDRQGVQVTPQTHIDSVMDSNGNILTELFAPLTHVGSYGDSQHKVVDSTNAGFMSPEQLDHLEHSTTDAYVQVNSDDTEIPAVDHDTITFKSGHNITLVPDTGENQSITFNHNTLTTTSTSRTSQATPGDTYTIEEDYTVDDMGHVATRKRLQVTMPVLSRFNTLEADTGVIYLGGAKGVTGNQTVYASTDLNYDPETGILSAPITDSNLLGGATGSIPYQSDANSTTMLNIGTEGQTLKVASGVPVWEDDKGVKSVKWTNGSANGPTGTITLMDDSTVAIPAIPAASQTTSGIITTGTQTIAGDKTFTDGITGHISDLTGGAKGSLPYQNAANDTVMLAIGDEGYILTSRGGIPIWEAHKGVKQYTWTQGTTAGPILNTTLADGSVVSAPPVPSASSTASGVVTTGEQIFAGNKQFLGSVTVDGDFTVHGNLYATEEHDLIVSDKRITMSYTDSPTTETANGSGIEVVTYANPDETDPAQKYHGPSLLWYSDKGWSTENTDPNTARSLDINLGGPDAVYRINGTQVLSSTQYIGNSATANKVNHKITWFDGKTFNGSADVTINYDSVGAAVKKHNSTGTEYGVASTTDYGHVKISNGIVVNNGVITANYGGAGTALASAASAGTSIQLSRADHVHPFPAINSCTGTLNVNKGGTGKTSLTANALLYGAGTSAMKETNVGTQNQVVMANATGVPTFTTLVMAHISDSGDVPRIADTGLTCSDFAVA